MDAITYSAARANLADSAGKSRELSIVQNAGCDYGPAPTKQEHCDMNILGFVAFAGGFSFVMWTLSKLMTDRNDAPVS